MKIAFFDSHEFEIAMFEKLNVGLHDINFIRKPLTVETASLAWGNGAVCSFVNDKLNAECLALLKNQGVGLIALRSAGYNHIDLKAAKELGFTVCRVPAYSPYSVAEYTVGLLLSLNRKIHRAYTRVRELNFSLEGLTGFDLHGKNVGVVGTGRIGKIFANIMLGFGCQIIACDMNPDPELQLNSNVRYTNLENLLRESDVISLHLPLTKDSRHLLGPEQFTWMKPGALVINTGRGGLIDSMALIEALKREKIGGAALDVYEIEENVFFHDLSDKILKDDVLARLLTFPNVLVTSHQAFLTKEALHNIATATLQSITEFQSKGTVSSDKRLNL